MGGGSGGGGPTSSTTYTSNLPEYARPYFERMMERAEAESNQGYVGYGKDRLSNLSQDTQTGFGITRNLAAQGTPEIDQATGMASTAAMRGMGDINAARGGISGTLSNATPQMQAARQASYESLGRGSPQIAAAQGLTQQGVQGGFAAARGQQLAETASQRGFQAGDYASNAIQQSGFGQGAAQEYMSPYMSNVVEQQRQAAVRNFEEGRPQRESAAIKSGAFGGYRSAIQEGVAQRGLGTQLNEIEAVGRQKAFENAQAQFERDRAASMQAQTTTEQQRLAGEQFGLAGANLGLQSGQAINQMGLGQQNVALQGAGLMANMGASQQQLGLQQAGLLGQLSGQEAQLGLQGARDLAQIGTGQQQFGLQQAGMLGNLGAQRQGLELQQAGALQQQGSVQQQEEQKRLDLGYQDFLNQRDFDKQQINYLSSIMRGIPVQPSTVQSTYANPNPYAQFAGLGIAGLGLMR